MIPLWRARIRFCRYVECEKYFPEDSLESSHSLSDVQKQGDLLLVSDSVGNLENDLIFFAESVHSAVNTAAVKV